MITIMYGVTVNLWDVWHGHVEIKNGWTCVAKLKYQLKATMDI